MIIISNVSLSQISYIDSMMSVVKNAEEDSNLVLHYVNIADAYTFANIDSALKYSEKSFELTKKIGYNKGLGRAKIVEGQAFFRQGIYDVADSLYKVALKYAEQYADTQALAIASNNLGLVYMNQSKYVESIDLFLKTIEYYKASNSEDHIPGTLANIGVIYYYQNNIDMALKYMIESANLLKSYDLKKSVIYRNIGAFYSLKKNLDSAFYYARIAIEYDSINGNIKGLATGYNNMAEFYGQMNNLEKSAEYFFRSIELKKQLNDQRGLMVTYHNLGVLYNGLAQPYKALEYLLEASHYAKKMNNIETQLEIARDLANTYQSLNNIKKSYLHYKVYHELSDSLNKLRYDEKLLESQSKYDSELKEQEIETLKQAKKIEVLKSKKNKTIAISLTIFAFVLLVFIYYISRLLRIKKQNNYILREQNEEINQQKEEIAAQKDEIEKHRDQVIEQKEFIERQNKEINDSILYAFQIQQAVFPTENLFRKHFTDYFIFNKPKNVVSGDFYWITEKNDNVIIVVADCTGHGVPGAFMSLLGITYLNEIMKDNQDLNPSDILLELREKVISGLQQEGKKREAKDGMVVSICIVNKQESKIYFSGAGSDLLFIKNGEFSEIKGEKSTISIGSDNQEFSIQEIDFDNSCLIYLYTDGYVDQFNVDGSKKFSRKKFYNLIQEVKEMPMNEQQNIINNKFEQWKGDFEQIDDILVCGIKL
jgi:serine phosphatase RsbU (regulator of sigma subunit)